MTTTITRARAARLTQTSDRRRSPVLASDTGKQRADGRAIDRPAAVDPTPRNALELRLQALERAWELYRLLETMKSCPEYGEEPVPHMLQDMLENVIEYIEPTEPNPLDPDDAPEPDVRASQWPAVRERVAQLRRRYAGVQA